MLVRFTMNLIQINRGASMQIIWDSGCNQMDILVGSPSVDAPSLDGEPGLIFSAKYHCDKA